MLSELCRELKNWFDRGQPHIYDSFKITDGKITDTSFTEVIKTNQYFRIIGSVFNDGIYKYTDELTLIDESFTGAIWPMAVPKEVIDLSEEIDQWLSTYGSTINSPYQSESFGGYSYTKASGGSGEGSNGSSWQSVFASKLNMWRKI